jgi:hypothetical protein
MNLTSGECNENDTLIAKMIQGKPLVNRIACIQTISPTSIESLADSVNQPLAVALS